MKKIFKDALILFAITAIAGLLLALVNEATKAPIEAQKVEAKQEACKNVFPDATSFSEDTEKFINGVNTKGWDDKAGKITVDQIYTALDGNGEVLGFVLNVTTKEGYGGGITFAMGIRNDRTLNGISILSSSETVGLGLEADKVLAPQFVNKNVDSFTYTKTGKTSDSEIDAISSATITTNAIVNAVNAGLKYFDILTGGTL